MDDSLFFSPRFVFQKSSVVVDEKYNRGYKLNSAALLVVLMEDLEKNVYWVRTSTGEQVDSSIKNNVSRLLEGKNRRAIKRELQSKNIQLIMLKTVPGCFRIKNEDLNKKIAELNTLLQKKCRALSLRLGKIAELSGKKTLFSQTADWVLCLYYKGDCISSITFDLYNNNTAMEIYSKTNKIFMKKKYNTLLRFALVFIAKSIWCQGVENPNIKIVSSNAANKVSAWVLMNNFEVNIAASEPSFKDYMEGIEQKEYTKENIFNFYERNRAMGNIELEIPLNHTNIDKAFELFKALTHPKDGKLLCSY